MFNYSGRAQCYFEIIVKTDMSYGTYCFSSIIRVQTIQTSFADQNYQIKLKGKLKLLVLLWVLPLLFIGVAQLWAYGSGGHKNQTQSA